MSSPPFTSRFAFDLVDDDVAENEATRVYIAPVYFHFVMKVVARNYSRVPNQRYLVTPLDNLALPNQDLRAVRIPGLNAVSMIYGHDIPISSLHTHHRDTAFGWCHNRRPLRGRDVDGVVRHGLVVDRVHSGLREPAR